MSNSEGDEVGILGQLINYHPYGNFFFLVLGKFFTKSMAMCSNFHSGSSNFCISLVDLPCSIFTYRYMIHFAMNYAISFFMTLHQKYRRTMWYIFVLLRWILYLEQCIASNTSLLSSRTSDTHNLPCSLTLLSSLCDVQIFPYGCLEPLWWLLKSSLCLHDCLHQRGANLQVFLDGFLVCRNCWSKWDYFLHQFPFMDKHTYY